MSQEDRDERSILLIDPIDGASDISDNHNHWDVDSYNTVNNWKKSLAKSYFIYQFLIDEYKKKYNRMLISVLIFSTLATILTAINTTMQEVDDDVFFKKQTFVINIILCIVNGVIFIGNGIIKIYKFDQIISDYTSYVEKLDGLCSVIHDQLILPSRMREDAKEFIKKRHPQYTDLIKKSPMISTSDYKSASKKYDTFTTDREIHDELSERYKIKGGLLDA